MPKMKFNTRVKYKDAIHGGLEVFDVSDEDVQEMQARGGVIVIDKTKPKEPEPLKEPEPQKEPEKKEDQKRGKKKAAGE